MLPAEYKRSDRICLFVCCLNPTPRYLAVKRETTSLGECLSYVYIKHVFSYNFDNYVLGR